MQAWYHPAAGDQRHFNRLYRLILRSLARSGLPSRPAARGCQIVRCLDTEAIYLVTQGVSVNSQMLSGTRQVAFVATQGGENKLLLELAGNLSQGQTIVRQLLDQLAQFAVQVLPHVYGHTPMRKTGRIAESRSPRPPSRSNFCSRRCATGSSARGAARFATPCFPADGCAADFGHQRADKRRRHQLRCAELPDGPSSPTAVLCSGEMSNQLALRIDAIADVHRVSRLEHLRN